MTDIQTLSDSVPKRETYIGTDGLRHCKVCGDAVETVINVPLKGERKVGCICRCIREKGKAEAERERREECNRKREYCFGSSKKLMRYTFAASEDSPAIEIGQNYVKEFSKHRKNGKGIVFYGNVGTGKSHVAACIANALIDDGYRVVMTNFKTVINKIQASFEGRQKYLNELNKCSLLIIDDLGIENNSDYELGIVFNIIDRRYTSGLPLIVTTNLPINEIKKTDDIRKERVYDRVLEMCFPVEVNGESRRRKKVRETFTETRSLLGI